MSRTALVITAAVVLAGHGCGSRDTGGTSSGASSGSSTGAASGASGSTSGSGSGGGSRSGQGSSCLTVTDCQPGLVCLANVCSDNRAASGASAGTSSGSGTGTSSGTSGTSSGRGTNCNLTASASVSGTLLGKSLTPKDAFTIQMVTPGMYMTSVALVDYPNACLLNPVQSVKASSKILVLRFSGGGPLGTGAFTVPSTVTAQYASYDPVCMPTGESATVGSVHVTQASACGVAGTFDLALNSDHVTGSFVAPTCNPVSTDGGQCL